MTSRNDDTLGTIIFVEELKEAIKELLQSDNLSEERKTSIILESEQIIKAGLQEVVLYEQDRTFKI